MKKLLFLSLLLLFVNSCTKDPTTDPPSELVSTLKFKANGVLHEMNGSLATTSLEGSIIERGNTGLYHLGAEKGMGNNRQTIYLPLHENIVVAKFYPVHEGGIEFSLTEGYYISYENDVINLTISKIHDNVYADGIFDGQITKYMGTDKLNVTEGEFKNVKILK